MDKLYSTWPWLAGWLTRQGRGLEFGHTSERCVPKTICHGAYFLPCPQPFHLHHPFEFGGSATRLAWLQTLHGHRDKTVAVDGTRWGAVSAVSGCGSKGWMPGIAKVILEGAYNGSSDQNGHLESSLAWQGQAQGKMGK